MKEIIENVKNKLEDIKYDLKDLENALNQSITFNDTCFQKENLDKVNNSIDKQLDIIYSEVYNDIF